MSYAKPGDTKHLHNICTTKAQHCTNVIQMLSIYWVCGTYICIRMPVVWSIALYYPTPILVAMMSSYQHLIFWDRPGAASQKKKNFAASFRHNNVAIINIKQEAKHIYQNITRSNIIKTLIITSHLSPTQHIDTSISLAN